MSKYSCTVFERAVRLEILSGTARSWVFEFECPQSIWSGSVAQGSRSSTSIFQYIRREVRQSKFDVSTSLQLTRVHSSWHCNVVSASSPLRLLHFASSPASSPASYRFAEGWTKVPECVKRRRSRTINNNKQTLHWHCAENMDLKINVELELGNRTWIVKSHR